MSALWHCGHLMNSFTVVGPTSELSQNKSLLAQLFPEFPF